MPLQPSFTTPLLDNAGSPDDNASYLQATAQLKPVIEGKLYSTNIYNVSAETFDLLQYLDGWEKLRCVISSDTISDKLLTGGLKSNLLHFEGSPLCQVSIVSSRDYE